MVLKTRIIAVTVLVLFLSVAVSTAITINVQNRKMVTAEMKDIEILSSIIQRTIEESMSKGNTEDVQRALENVGRSEEILNLRVISKDGYILKSKKPGEIGLKTSESASLKDIDHSPKSLIKDNDITYLAPIPNRKQCHGCHSKDIDYNGIIEIKYDFTRSKADIMAIKRLLLVSSIFTVFLVSGILSLLFTRVITTPLGRLLNTINQVEGGNWDARVQVSGNDELGAIGRSFNTMLQEVKNLYEKGLRKEKEISRVKTELDHKKTLEELNTQLHYKVKEVETANKAVLSLSKEVKVKNVELEKMVERLKKINDIGSRLTTIIEIEDLLKLIIRTTAEMLNVEKGFIHLIRNEQTKLTLQYQRGLGVEGDSHQAIEHHPVYIDLIREGKPVFVGGNKGHSGDFDRAYDVPSIGVPLKMKGQIIGGMLLENRINGGQFSSDEVELLETMANHAIVAIENAWLYETIKTNYFGTVQSLINALEANDRYTKGHSERVRYMSMELGRFIGLDNKELEVLEHAAILHDIGKIGIDSAVLNKTSKLTNSEFSLIKTHPVISDEILGPIGALEGVRTTVLQHHERYDGKGYPYGIAGEEISLKARVLSVVDSFDAMLAARPYREAFPMHKAITEIKTCSGSQFDPFIVKAFIEMVDTNPNILRMGGYNLG